MSLFLILFIPAGWALTGRLLGGAVSLSVPTESGQRLGRALGWWAAWLFPGVYFVLLVVGGSGNAGQGMRLFGSDELFGLLCLSLYTVPVLVGYVILAYVIRDLLRGWRGRGLHGQQSAP
jgi:hypothetical protein